MKPLVERGDSVEQTVPDAIPPVVLEHDESRREDHDESGLDHQCRSDDGAQECADLAELRGADALLREDLAANAELTCHGSRQQQGESHDAEAPGLDRDEDDRLPEERPV